MLEIEADEREQQREWNGNRDDQARPEIVEEKYEDHDDEEHALQQIALDGLGRQ